LSWSKVSGVAQKGPFLNGASVTLSELDESLTPTGRSFQASILDDTGAFIVKNVELQSAIATLRVDGFYFNEVRGERSTSQITLSSIVDLSDDQDTNVNLLSHLEKGRVEKLIEDGASFADAKAQAEAEILDIFGFGTDAPSQADDLDISMQTDEAASLLALSVILVGYRSDAELTELLANIATDLRTDGTLDSTRTLTSLVAHARALEPAKVRENLQSRYDELGKPVVLADFESRIAQFVAAHSDLPAIPLLEYPEGSLLARLAAGVDGMTLEFGGGPSSSIKLTLPGGGMPLKVVLRTAPTGSSWVYSSPSGLDITQFDLSACAQSFSLVDTDTAGAVDVGLYAGAFEVLVYEGNQASPSWSRKFNATNPDAAPFGQCTAAAAP
jgi:hypothetical protein